MMARRDATDPREQGIAPNWAWAWPANRRILYNRACADLAGKPWNPSKRSSSGTAAVGRHRRARLRADHKPLRGCRSVHHERRGARAPVRPRGRWWRPVPRALRAVRIAGRQCPASEGADEPGGARVRRRQGGIWGASEFPYVATTYRLTEHFHFWTKHALINAILQPEEFVEIGEALAKEKGIAQGGWVRVSSKRGSVVARPTSPSASAR